jgi:seryl-tRNA synthetase
MSESEQDDKMFREQHRDCDAMGVENQHLRAELERLKADNKFLSEAIDGALADRDYFDQLANEMKGKRAKMSDLAAHNLEAREALIAELAQLKAQMGVGKGDDAKLVACRDCGKLNHPADLSHSKLCSSCMSG